MEMLGEVRRVVAHIEKVHLLLRVLGTEWWYGKRHLPVFGIKWRLFRIGRMLGQPFEVVEFDEVLDIRRPLRVCVKQRCILDFATSTHQLASPRYSKVDSVHRICIIRPLPDGNG
jgi:hypothetical protein